jgi:hypothetical protein
MLRLLILMWCLAAIMTTMMGKISPSRYNATHCTIHAYPQRRHFLVTDQTNSLPSVCPSVCLSDWGLHIEWKYSTDILFVALSWITIDQVWLWNFLKIRFGIDVSVKLVASFQICFKGIVSIILLKNDWKKFAEKTIVIT